MQHCAVADVAVAPDHRVTLREAVHHAGVLNIGALFQDDAPEVAAQAGQRADIAAGSDDHIADQHRTGVHIGAGVDDRGQAVEAVARHGSVLIGPRGGGSGR
ncbi:hypothetical protein D3C79_870460 [compost metagenome]